MKLAIVIIAVMDCISGRDPIISIRDWLQRIRIFCACCSGKIVIRDHADQSDGTISSQSILRRVARRWLHGRHTSCQSRQEKTPFDSKTRRGSVELL